MDFERIAVDERADRPHRLNRHFYITSGAAITRQRVFRSSAASRYPEALTLSLTPSGRGFRLRLP
jgi:hypothetical protein